MLREKGFVVKELEIDGPRKGNHFGDKAYVLPTDEEGKEEERKGKKREKEGGSGGRGEEEVAMRGVKEENTSNVL